MRRRFNLWRRLREDRDGSATVEFAFVAPLFVTMLLVIFELGYTILKIVSLDDAVAQASRFIYTGAATNGSVSRNDIATFICDNAHFLDDCQNNIMIEARVINGFDSQPTDTASCEDASDGKITAAANYVTGGAADVMFLRVCVVTDMLFPLNNLGLDLEKTDSGRTQIVSSTAFANEPF